MASQVIPTRMEVQNNRSDELIAKIADTKVTEKAIELVKTLQHDLDIVTIAHLLASMIQSENSVKGKDNATLYSEGVRHFAKKRYEEAQKRFTVTDKKGYKPAASNYYLGEIAYYTKKYEDAIFHFKKSAGLYDQASYIDTLLFHTAVSLEKTGDKAQAKMFYKNIIENYPTKKTAKIAKQRLKKL